MLGGNLLSQRETAGPVEVVNFYPSNWVAVKEFKSIYHNGCVYMYTGINMVSPI